MGSALVHQTIELIAEKDCDITPIVYHHLFSSSEDAVEVFSGTPKNQRGTMISKSVEMILDFTDDQYDMIEFRKLDIPLHDELGVTPALYRCFFDALISSFSEVLADQWTPKHQEAWEQQFTRLMEEIIGHSQNVAVNQ